MINKVIKNILLNLHIQHERAYSYYKVRETEVSFEYPLDAEERKFYLALRSVLAGDDLTIYDIGAARGVTSSCFAKLQNVRSIHAFEPIPEAYEKLVNKVKNFSKVHCHNLALGSQENILTMNISSNKDSSSLLSMHHLHKTEFPHININNQIEVPVVCLDDYVETHQMIPPDVVKIDVQGYEMEVIQGGFKTICQAKYCVLEMSFEKLYEDSPLFEDIYKMMYSLGFKIVGFSDPLRGSSGLQLQIDGIFENQNSAIPNSKYFDAT